MHMRIHKARPILLGILLVLMILPVTANAEATKEKCKCDLESPNDNMDGAEVSNAGKCFLVSDEDRNWCIFDIEFLRYHQVFEEEFQFDTMLKQSVENQNNNKLTQLLSDRFDFWTTWGDGASVLYKLGDINQDDLGHVLGDILSAGEQGLIKCMTSFITRTQREDGEFMKEDSELIQYDMFGCGVHPNGWLTLKLDVNGFSVYYLREPLHESVR